MSITSNSVSALGASERTPSGVSRRSASKSYIPTLDGWRTIAVLLVIAAHSTVMLGHSQSKLAHKLAGFFGHAGYGVDIFFALSGYLIGTLLLREKERTGTISLGRFYVRRVFRILPPMLVYLGCVAVLRSLAILPRTDQYDFKAVLLFYRNYLPQDSWYTGHFWSLSIEEQFYAVIPLLLLLLSGRAALRAAYALCAVCIAVRWYEFSHISDGTMLQFRTENRYDGLLWGCVLALLLQDAGRRAWLRKHLTVLVFFGLIVATAIALTVFPAPAMRRTVVAAVLPVLIAYTMLRPEEWVGRILEFSWMRWLGRLSYSLYLWQMMFLPQQERPLGRLQDFPFSLICPLLCAAASFYIVEKPLTRIGHRFAKSPGALPDGRM